MASCLTRYPLRSLSAITAAALLAAGEVYTGERLRLSARLLSYNTIWYSFDSHWSCHLAQKQHHGGDHFWRGRVARLCGRRLQLEMLRGRQEEHALHCLYSW